MNEELIHYIKEERVFLHDLSNQLVIAQGMGAFVQKLLAIEKAADSKEVLKMGKTMKAIDSMIEMIQNRREAIKGKQAASGSVP